jgi:hypothetical protein
VWTASVTVTAGDIALQVRIDDEHWLAVERIGDTVRARSVVGAMDHVLATERVGSGDTALVIRAVLSQGHSHRRGPDRLEVGVIAQNEFILLGSLDGRYLSTEVAGGFTGRVIGIEALGTESVIASFEYRAGAVTA